MRMTRAYIEGYTEGRFGSMRAPKNPHPRAQEKNEWVAGYDRGLAVKAYAEETKSDRAYVNDEVLRIRRGLGEKV